MDNIIVLVFQSALHHNRHLILSGQRDRVSCKCSIFQRMLFSCPIGSYVGLLKWRPYPRSKSKVSTRHDKLCTTHPFGYAKSYTLDAAFYLQPRAVVGFFHNSIIPIYTTLSRVGIIDTIVIRQEKKLGPYALLRAPKYIGIFMWAL